MNELLLKTTRSLNQAITENGGYLYLFQGGDGRRINWFRRQNNILQARLCGDGWTNIGTYDTTSTGK